MATRNTAQTPREGAERDPAAALGALDDAPAAAPVDGRRLRREQGRLAVIDATIDLILAGYGPLTVEQVAEQAGVSAASVYRYFASIDALRDASVQRYLERYSHLLAIPEIGEGALPDRIDRVVSARLGLYTSVEPVARFARQQATRIDSIGETLRRVRLTMCDQLAQHFASELDRLRPTARRERLAVITILTAFESWDHMRELGIQPAAIERAWRVHLTVLLDDALVAS